MQRQILEAMERSVGRGSGVLVGRRQRTTRRLAETQQHGALVERVDLVGVDKTAPVVGVDHETVEDVLWRRREHAPHAADGNATLGEHRRSAFQEQIRDRCAGLRPQWLIFHAGIRSRRCVYYAADVASRTARRGLAPLLEERVRIAGTRTRVLRLEGAGPTFVLLHGFADSADTWRGVLAELRLAGRAAVALDMPGFATADPLVEYAGVLDQLGEFARGAAEHYGDALLVGNSLGGSAALIAAGQGAAPAGVVAIAPAGFDMGGWIYRLRSYSLLQWLLRAPPLLPAVALRVVIGQIYRQLAICDQRVVSDETIRLFASHHGDRATVLHYLNTAGLLVPELRRPLPIAGITAPVLVVWGKQDRMLAVRNAELVLEQIPHATLELAERCGHCPQVERPAWVAELLLSRSR